MSDSFLVATRIVLGRADFERWLDTPIDAGRVGNAEAMFDGWFWDGTPARWSPEPAATTPREFFADGVDGACAGGPQSYVLLYRDGALEAYLMYFGFRETAVCTALAAFATAGRFAAEPAHVLFWAETGANLGEADWDGRLAVLSVDRDGAGFVGPTDLRAAVTALRPAERRFFELVARLAEDEDEDRDDEEFESDIPRDPAFVDPAVLA